MTELGSTGSSPPPPGPTGPDGVPTHGPLAVVADGTNGDAWDRRARVGRALGALDDAVEQVLGQFRGHRGIDTAALVTSNLADYGFVWAVLAAAKGRRAGQGRRRALWALALSGVASATVNAAVKQVVQRQRPAAAGGPVDGSLLPVRRPSSTSFPSGHTLAAFCTAMVLPDGAWGVAAALGFAVAVGASRVHLRAHHASDVVGGALIGVAGGVAVRSLVPRR